MGFNLTPKRVLQGNSQLREVTEPFSFWHSVSAAILYFQTLCALLRSCSTPGTSLLHCFSAEAYLGTSITVPCTTDSSIGLPEFYVTHISLSDGPGCKIQEAQLLLCSSKWSETCGTEENGHQWSFAVRGLVLLPIKPLGMRMQWEHTTLTSVR